MTKARLVFDALESSGLIARTDDSAGITAKGHEFLCDPAAVLQAPERHEVAAPAAPQTPAKARAAPPQGRRSTPASVAKQPAPVPTPASASVSHSQPALAASGQKPAPVLPRNPITTKRISAAFSDARKTIHQRGAHVDVARVVAEGLQLLGLERCSARLAVQHGFNAPRRWDDLKQYGVHMFGDVPELKSLSIESAEISLRIFAYTTQHVRTAHDLELALIENRKVTSFEGQPAFLARTPSGLLAHIALRLGPLAAHPLVQRIFGDLPR